MSWEWQDDRPDVHQVGVLGEHQWNLYPDLVQDSSAQLNSRVPPLGGNGVGARSQLTRKSGLCGGPGPSPGG